VSWWWVAARLRPLYAGRAEAVKTARWRAVVAFGTMFMAGLGAVYECGAACGFGVAREARQW